MSTLYGYMSPFELKLAREDAKLELEGSRLIYEYEMLEKEHELMLEEIELKSIFMEGCTSDDLYMMYEDENESNEEKKEGILTKIWNWLKNIFNAIIGKTKETIRYIVVDVNYAIGYSVDKINNILNDVENVIGKFKGNKDAELTKDDIKKYNHISAIVDIDDNGNSKINEDSYINAIKDKGSVPGDKLKSGFESLSNRCKEILNTIGDATTALSRSIAGFLRAIVSRINTTVTVLLNQIKNKSDNSGTNELANMTDEEKNKILNGIKNIINDAKNKIPDEVKQAFKDDANKVLDKFVEKFGKKSVEVANTSSSAAVNFIENLFSGGENKGEEQKKGEEHVDQNSVHDVDDVYSSIFESLDIDTIDSTFEKSYSESYNNDLDDFANILDDLLQ